MAAFSDVRLVNRYPPCPPHALNFGFQLTSYLGR